MLKFIFRFTCCSHGLLMECLYLFIKRLFLWRLCNVLNFWGWLYFSLVCILVQYTLFNVYSQTTVSMASSVTVLCHMYTEPHYPWVTVTRVMLFYGTSLHRNVGHCQNVALETALRSPVGLVSNTVVLGGIDVSRETSIWGHWRCFGTRRQWLCDVTPELCISVDSNYGLLTLWYFSHPTVKRVYNTWYHFKSASGIC